MQALTLYLGYTVFSVVINIDVQNMQDQGPSKAIIVILSAPSGGGKSSVSKALLAKDPRLSMSVSVTTRKPRAGEVDGVQYFFKTQNEFKEMIDDGQFIEYTKIYGNFYGTLKKHLEDKLNQGIDILFDINVDGSKKIKAEMPYPIISIFLLPPNIEILRQRLEERSQDDQDTIDLRMMKATQEIENAKYYDYVVINDDFKKTVQQILEIINQERKLNANYKI
jgi:guanylate kinase